MPTVLSQIFWRSGHVDDLCDIGCRMHGPAAYTELVIHDAKGIEGTQTIVLHLGNLYVNSGNTNVHGIPFIASDHVVHVFPLRETQLIPFASGTSVICLCP